jgi:hypothetical protein
MPRLGALYRDTASAAPQAGIPRGPAIVSELVGLQGRAEPQCLAAQRPPSSCRPSVCWRHRMRRIGRRRRSPSYHNSVQPEWALWIRLPAYRRLLPSAQHRRQGPQCEPRSIASASLRDAACCALARLVRMAALAEWVCPAPQSQPRRSTRRYRCGWPNWLPGPGRVSPQPRQSARRCAQPCALPEEPSPALAPASTRACTQVLQWPIAP